MARYAGQIGEVAALYLAVAVLRDPVVKDAALEPQRDAQLPGTRLAVPHQEAAVDTCGSGDTSRSERRAGNTHAARPPDTGSTPTGVGSGRGWDGASPHLLTLVNLGRLGYSFLHVLLLITVDLP